MREKVNVNTQMLVARGSLLVAGKKSRLYRGCSGAHKIMPVYALDRRLVKYLKICLVIKVFFTRLIETSRTPKAI
jgi:hypothetical protein